MKYIINIPQILNNLRIDFVLETAPNTRKKPNFTHVKITILTSSILNLHKFKSTYYVPFADRRRSLHADVSRSSENYQELITGLIAAS